MVNSDRIDIINDFDENEDYEVKTWHFEGKDIFLNELNPCAKNDYFCYVMLSLKDLKTGEMFTYPLYYQVPTKSIPIMKLSNCDTSKSFSIIKNKKNHMIKSWILSPKCS